VGDVICLWDGAIVQLENFFQSINGLHPTIQISLHDHRHNSEIHRKATSINIFIWGHFHHYPLPSSKNAVILNMVHRVLSVFLSPVSFKKEVSIISYLIDIWKLIRKNALLKSLIGTATIHEIEIKQKKWINFPYLGKLSTQISKIICWYDVNSQRVRTHKNPEKICFRCSPSWAWPYIRSSSTPLDSWQREQIIDVRTCTDNESKI